MAGLQKAIQDGYVSSGEVGVLDSTAHMLKFSTFQEMYFNDSFGPEFNVKPRSELKNAPRLVKAETIKKYPEQGKPLHGEDLKQFIHETSLEIAKILNLEKIS